MVNFADIGLDNVICEPSKEDEEFYIEMTEAERDSLLRILPVLFRSLLKFDTEKHTQENLLQLFIQMENCIREGKERLIKKNEKVCLVSFFVEIIQTVLLLYI